MKKKSLFLASAVLVAAASCARMPLGEAVIPDESSDSQTGTLIVNVRNGSPLTRAEADDESMSEFDEEMEYEMAVSKVEILVFDKATGKLNGYMDAGTATTATLNVTSGTKNVYAVVNSPVSLSGITDENALNDVSISLEDNHLDEKGFVMAAMEEVTITAGATNSPVIEVDRFTSRIALVKVTNNLPPAYGNLKIEDVFLTNVVANQNLGGDAGRNNWYNVMGRIAKATDGKQIIGLGENIGTCPGLTHKAAELTVPNAASEGADLSYPEPNYLFYAYPNDSGAAGKGVSWNTDPFPGDKTRLFLTATVDEKYFYYPIVIDKLERNKSYDVSVKISGFGVDDPNGLIEKGAISFTVNPTEWTMGGAIEKDL